MSGTNDFRKGKAVENKSHDWRPRISLIEQNIAAVRGLFKNDCRIKVKEISFKAGKSFGSVETIIVGKLRF